MKRKSLYIQTNTHTHTHTHPSTHPKETCHETLRLKLCSLLCNFYTIAFTIMMIRVISSSLHILLLPPPASTSPPPQALQSYKCIGTRYLLGRRSDDHHRTSRLLHILRSANTDEYNEEPLAPELEVSLFRSLSLCLATIFFFFCINQFNGLI